MSCKRCIVPKKENFPDGAFQCLQEKKKAEKATYIKKVGQCLNARYLAQNCIIKNTAKYLILCLNHTSTIHCTVYREGTVFLKPDFRLLAAS